ncbi:MAG TPA: DUF1972 domain-containing protein [Terriglobales bacterium]|nr:DUF1972 domain-containing protein [Terriglobales bacterium]
MKLAILGSRGIPARYGGFETFAEELATRLVRRGHSVTVFCELSQHNPTSYRGVQLEYVKASPWGALSTIRFDLTSLWRVRKGFDFVYMLGYGASFFCWLPRLYGTQLWINMDGLEWTRTKWNAIARLYLRASEAIATLTPNRIIADASAMKANLESRYSRLPICDVIPYGAEIPTQFDVECLTEFEVSKGEYYLVVCRLEPENHISEIVEGFAQSGIARSLIVVGDRNTPTSYVRNLLRHESSRIRFVGTVYDKLKLASMRRYCRAYIHGHSVGGTNPSLLEAMACGNVVLAHDNIFNREVLGDSGLFFQSSQELSKQLIALDGGSVSDDVHRVRNADRARTLYNWERITDAYCELMRISSEQLPSKRNVCVNFGPDAHLPSEMSAR